MQPATAELCYPGVCMDELTARLAEDLDGTFETLVRRHQDLVFGVALRVVRDGGRAEDVAQEAFVRAYRALKKYPDQRIRELRPRPWLARIALNLARNDVRRAHPYDDLEAVAERATPADDSPVRLAERRAEGALWARLLNQLPRRYGLAVALRHVDGLSYDELSQTLDRPLGSVKSDVHRGIVLLRAAYDAEQRRIAELEAAS